MIGFDAMRSFLLWTFGFSAVLTQAGTAEAATVYRNVHTTGDLMSVFSEADANPSNYYYTTVYGGIYTPSSTLQLNKGRLKLVGPDLASPGSAIIDGQGTRRVISLSPPSGFSPYLEAWGITISNGSTESSGGGLQVLGGTVLLNSCDVSSNASTLPGAGIAVQSAALYLFLSTVRENVGHNLTAGGGQNSIGGGIALGADSYAQIEQSSVVDNKNIRGAGIAATGNAQLYLTNSTLGGNRASAKGGGLLVSETATVVMQFNTVSNNTAGDQSGIGEPAYGGGLAISNYTGAFTLVGTILAGNTTRITNGIGTSRGDNCFEDLVYPSSFTASLHGNIIGGLENCVQLGSVMWPNMGTTDALLGLYPIANNASSNAYVVPTFMPKSTSVAIQAYSRYWWVGGTSTLPCPSSDARGYARTSTSLCDIGAVDYTSHH